MRKLAGGSLAGAGIGGPLADFLYAESLSPGTAPTGPAALPFSIGSPQGIVAVVAATADTVLRADAHNTNEGRTRRAADGSRPLAEVISLADEFDAVVGEMLAGGHLGTEENALTILYHRDRPRFTPISFSTWYHEDTGFTQAAPGDMPFYRAFETLTASVTAGSSLR